MAGRRLTSRAQSAKRCQVCGDSHEGRAASSTNNHLQGRLWHFAFACLRVCGGLMRKGCVCAHAWAGVVQIRVCLAWKMPSSRGRRPKKRKRHSNTLLIERSNLRKKPKKERERWGFCTYDSKKCSIFLLDLMWFCTWLYTWLYSVCPPPPVS